MADLTRLSFSIEESLAKKLDQLMARDGFTNRSEFLRDLIRQNLVEEEWEDDRVVVASILLVYDHHQRMLTDRLTELQHHHHETVLATTHVHLDHSMCAEVIILRGNAGRIRAVCDAIRSQRGVLHASLALGSTGTDLQ